MCWPPPTRRMAAAATPSHSCWAKAAACYAAWSWASWVRAAGCWWHLPEAAVCCVAAVGTVGPGSHPPGYQPAHLSARLACRDGTWRARAAGHPALVRLPAQGQRAAAARGPAPRGASGGGRHGARGGVGVIACGVDEAATAAAGEGSCCTACHCCRCCLLADRPGPGRLPSRQLTAWLPGAGVRCVGAASDVFLRTLQPGQGWETPRPPFEVQLHLEARTASTTGRPGEGQPYFSTSSGEPLACALGAGQLPPGGPRMDALPCRSC